MMIVYYTHSFGNNKGESHRLLEEAIARYLVRCSSGGACDPEAKAAELVSSMQRAGEYGKPYIPGFAPFSISHSLNTWAVLIGEDRECGLDIQYGRKSRTASVAERFYAEEDAARVADMPDEEDRKREFFRLWTRREALVKAAGTSVADTGAPAVSGDEAEYKGRTYRILDIDIPGEDLFAAVCAEEELTMPEVTEL